jgi:exonuclease VII small subunit
LKQLDDALAAFERGLRLGVEVGAELREGRQFAELGEVAA